MEKIRKNRWQYYNLTKNKNFEIFWNEHLSNQKNILYILGIGFDPRMCLGIETITKFQQNSNIDCMTISYHGKSIKKTPESIDRENNEKKLESILGTKIKRIKKDVTSPKSSTSVESRNISKIFTNIGDFDNYTDIVVDISAFPTNLYFPLIGRILDLLDNNSTGKLFDFHVIVAENIEIDKKITEEEIDYRADYVFGFASDLGKESDKKPHVWIPILGENSDVQLDKIRSLINPIEICPLIPSPSKNPRRGDDLLQIYDDVFTKFEIEIRNYIYGDEQNPFEAYRQIMDTAHNYPEILNSYGGCKIAISVLTSKLLSISALLVAYECKTKKDLSVGIAHVSGKRYVIESDAKDEVMINKSELFSLWLKGSCYE